MLDFNDAKKQRPDGASIPDGTVVKLIAHIRPGGVHGEHERDVGLLRQSQTSDAQMLDWEFTVTWPPRFAKQNVWQLMTVRGGKVDEHGDSIAWGITRSQLRAMIDSALGLDPDDDSPATSARRVMTSFSDFEGIEFTARIGVELGGDNGRGGTFADKNTIARVITPDTQEWKSVQQGIEPPPKPSRAKPAAQAAKPAGWGAPAAAAPPPAWASAAAAQALPASAPLPNGATMPPLPPSPPSSPVASGPAWLKA